MINNPLTFGYLYDFRNPAQWLPPGLPPEKFKPYAEVFAKEVIAAFA